MLRKLRVIPFVVTLLLSLAFAPTSHATLSAVGPVDPATTFPAYYQDSTGLSLAPCLDNNGFCSATMLAVPNPIAPIVWPTNFPDEGFIFLADNTLGTGRYRAALEFTGGPGAQITFARIRLFDKGAPIGTYTVTHPYGTFTVDVTPDNVARNQGLRFTEDLGLSGPPFAGALTGKIGPFLRTASAAPSGLVTNVADGNIYVGNSVTPGLVIGTPVTSVSIAPALPGYPGSLFTLEGKVLGMSVSPTAISFPVQRPNVDSAPVTVTVTNLSQVSPLALTAVAIQGTDVTSFHLVADTCSNASVPASTPTVPGTCTFNIVMNSPTLVSGPRTVTILVAGTLATVPKSTIAPVTGLIDAIPPVATAHFPDNPAFTQPANVAITTTFSEPMLLSSLTNTTFTVLKDGVGPVAGTWDIDPAQTTVSFTPTTAFLAGQVITAATTSLVTDLAGNGLVTALTFSFTTKAPDFVQPSISTISPANNTTGVRNNAPITVTFSEQMLSTSITASSITVRAEAFTDVNGVAVTAQVITGAITVANDPVLDRAIATFTPTVALASGRPYSVTVNTPGPTDLMRNALIAGQPATFVTNFQPSVPDVVSPTNGATGVGRPVVLTWKPSSDSDPADVITYHLFLCNNPSFIGTAPNCLQNVPVTPAAAKVNGVYYAGIGGGSILFSLGLGWAFGFKGRKRILTILAVLVVSGLFIASCKGGGGSSPAPAPSGNVSFSVNNLSPNVTYFWKLEADDGKGGVSTSNVMTFTTQ